MNQSRLVFVETFYRYLSNSGPFLAYSFLVVSSYKLPNGKNFLVSWYPIQDLQVQNQLRQLKITETDFFIYFRSFQTQIYRKTVGFNGIRTRIVRWEGEHADHLTTTTAHQDRYLSYEQQPIKNVLYANVKLHGIFTKQQLP